MLLFQTRFSLESKMPAEKVVEVLRQVIRKPRWIILQKRPATRYRGIVHPSGFQLTTDDRGWRLEASLGAHDGGTTIDAVVGIPVIQVVLPLLFLLLLIVLVLASRRPPRWHVLGIVALLAALSIIVPPRRCRLERDRALSFLSGLLASPSSAPGAGGGERA